MNSVWANAVILPFFATFVIPTTLVERPSGKWKGFLQWPILAEFVFLVWLQIWMAFLVENRDVNLDAIGDVAFAIFAPFIGAIIFVKYSHKELFGKEIKFTRWW